MSEAATGEQMRWASALSDQPSTFAAIDEALSALHAQLQRAPDLLLLFASVHHRPKARAIVEAVRSRYPACRVFGCTAAGVIGAGREIERRECLAVTGATLPGVAVQALHCRPSEAPTHDALRAAFDVAPSVQPHFIVLADPYDPSLAQLLAALDQAFPEATKVGGMFSGSAPGEGLLIDDCELRSEGSLLLALHGNLRVQGLVAQGCRPVGEPMIVTRCRDHIIDRLNVGTPVEALRALFDTLNPADQVLCRQALHLGLEMKANAHEFRPGDFLVREIVGLDPNSGAMSVGAKVHNYQVVQFHLRDGRSAAQDMDRQLAALQAGTQPRFSGALMFSCAGRGQALFGVANHDSDALVRHLGALPVTGFFAAGEIGCVDTTTFIHGYTCAVGLFGPR